MAKTPARRSFDAALGQRVADAIGQKAGQDPAAQTALREQLAQATGLTAEQVELVIAGQLEPSDEQRAAMAGELGVDLAAAAPPAQEPPMLSTETLSVLKLSASAAPADVDAAVAKLAATAARVPDLESKLAAATGEAQKTSERLSAVEERLLVADADAALVALGCPPAQRDRGLKLYRAMRGEQDATGPAHEGWAAFSDHVKAIPQPPTDLSSAKTRDQAKAGSKFSTFAAYRDQKDASGDYVFGTSYRARDRAAKATTEGAALFAAATAGTPPESAGRQVTTVS